VLATPGCLDWRGDLQRTAASRQTAAGVVMGQGEGSDTSVILAAAGEAAEQLVDFVGSAASRRVPTPPADSPTLPTIGAAI
jgi:hypothetical protein